MMPAVQPVSPPAPDTYSHVLRRYDRTAAIPIRLAGYNFNMLSQACDGPRGVAPTAFFTSKTAPGMRRYLARGWKDETKAFRAFHSGEVEVEVEAPVASELAPVAAASVVEATDKRPTVTETRPTPSGMVSIPGMTTVSKTVEKLRAPKKASK